MAPPVPAPLQAPSTATTITRVNNPPQQQKRKSPAGAIAQPSAEVIDITDDDGPSAAKRPAPGAAANNEYVVVPSGPVQITRVRTFIDCRRAVFGKTDKAPTGFQKQPK